MSAITVWANDRCSTSRGAEAILQERRVEYERIPYLEQAPSRAEPDLATADREQLLDALSSHPSLLQRPVVIRGDRALVARPAEKVLELLD